MPVDAVSVVGWMVFGVLLGAAFQILKGVV